MTLRNCELLLDGEWTIAFDPENIGKASGWQDLKEPPSHAGPIRVPSCWEQINPGYDGVAWYWRTLEAPAVDAGWRMILHFDAVNYIAEAWIDGRPIGRNEGGYTPFQFDVTEHIRNGGKHLLTVRVLDPPKEGELEGIVLKETPCWREYESYNFGGIWQSVRLLALPPAAITDCFIMPDNDLKGIAIELAIDNRTQATEVGVQLALADWRQPDKVLQSQTDTIALGSGEQRHTLHMSIAKPETWGPDHPHLYLLTSMLTAEANGQTFAHEKQTRFGLRRFDVADGRFTLNGRPIFVKGGFHEGLYPITFAAPPGREFVEDEIRKARSIGFNLLRFWQIPIHPLVLDVADEMGMMLMDEPPIEWMLQTERTVSLCEVEIRRLVLRDRNRPSVVVWTMLNEGAAVKSLKPVRRLAVGNDLPDMPITQAIDRLCRMARRLDPTRLIIDESGGWAKVAWMYRPGASEGEPINDVHCYIPGPTSDVTASPMRNFGAEDMHRGNVHYKAGAPVFVTEFGYGSIPHLSKAVAAYEALGAADAEDCVVQRRLWEAFQAGYARHRMDRFFESPDDLISETQKIHGESNYVQATALRSNPRVAGYVMHAFSAGGCILGAETHDLWKNEKLVAGAVAEFNAPRFLSVILSGTAVEQGMPLSAEVSLCNEEDSAGPQPLWLSVENEEGVRTGVDLGSVETPHGVSAIWSGTLPLDGCGEFRVTFGLGDRGRPMAKGRRTVHVLPDLPPPPSGKVCVATDMEDGRVRRALEGMGVPCVDNPSDARQIVAAVSDMGVESLPRLCVDRRLIVLPLDEPALRCAMKVAGIQGDLQNARGHWAPVSHYMEERALLTGLPSDRLLGQAFAGALPQHCILPFQEGTLAACLSYKQQVPWNVPYEFWWASAIVEKAVGKGRMVLCAMPLGQQASWNPVARRLLLNLLRLGEK